MIRRLFVACSIAALVFAWAAPAFAVKKGPTLGPGQSFTWKVGGFKTPTASPAACPASIDQSDVLCDHVLIGAAPMDWSRYTGSLSISIAFSSADDFNLYVFKSSELVTSSEGSGGTKESVTIPNPSGIYEVRVVPVQIAGSLLQGGAAYAGRATFAVQQKPAAVQQPSGSPNVSVPSGGNGPSFGTNPYRPTRPQYKIPSSSNYYAGYPAYGGSYSPGGLYQGPQYSGGGGTTQFSPDSTGAGNLYYQSAYGGPVKEGVPQKVAESTRDVAVGSAVARAPKALWLLLPLALLLLGGVAYLVVEPEGRGETVVAGEPDSFEIPSRVALGGIFLQSIAGLGRAFRLAQRWVASLRDRSE